MMFFVSFEQFDAKSITLLSELRINDIMIVTTEIDFNDTRISECISKPAQRKPK